VPTLKIGKATVDSATSAAGETLYWDTALKGFGLKVSASGNKTYLLQYRTGGRSSSTQRYTIGRHGSPWTPSGARQEAERLLLIVANGGDPRAAEKERLRVEQDLAFAAYANRFLNEYGRRHWRPRTWLSAESNMRRYVIPVLGKKTITAIARSDLVVVFDRLPATSPALPRNIFALVRKLFAWALERGDINRSPFEGYRSPPSVASRERVLSDEELAPIWAATAAVGEPFGVMVRLLLITGQRRNEVAAMDWSELNRRAATWSLPGARTKNARNHEIPLSLTAIGELDAIARSAIWPKSGPVFTTTGITAVSGFSRMKRRLDALATLQNDGEPLAAWRLHDLRRTMATGLQRLGIRFEVTEALLNHLSSARGGVAGVYQRHDWKEEKREAITAWGDHLSVWSRDELVRVNLED